MCRADRSGLARYAQRAMLADMALGATLHHLEIDWSDPDRNVYETMDLRVAQHPSETMRYLVARTLGLCLLWEPGLVFGRGLSTTDEPAAWAREPDGRIRLWMEVGTPSAERLHKASKAADRVAVIAYDGPETLRRTVGKDRVHRASEVEIVSIPTALLDALAERTSRHARWQLLHTGEHLFATVGESSFEGAIMRSRLAEP